MTRGSTWSKAGKAGKGNDGAIPVRRQRSQPARFHRQGRALRFRGKSSSPETPVFSPKTLPVEAVCTTAPETGNGIPIRHIVYESERKNQENSRQQVGKDGSIGPHSRHRVQLALFARHIPRMDRRGHRVFQGTVQVPLPDSLYARGARHHPVHPEFSGLLKSDPGTAPANRYRHA